MVTFAPLLAVALVALAALALRIGQARQRRHLLGNVVEVAGRDVSGPAILFFTGAACTVCHTAQRPALERLAPQIGGRVTVREIDVAAEPALAQQFRVMSLPTTVVLDRDGRAHAVNSGFAPAPVLQRQLAEAGLL